MGSSQSGEEFHVGKGQYIITISRYIETQMSAQIPFQFTVNFQVLKFPGQTFPFPYLVFPPMKDAALRCVPVSGVC